MTETLRRENFYSWDKDLRIIGSTTSKGAQPKWHHGRRDIYIKQDYHGYESVSEWAVFNILDKCSTVPKDLLVPYYLCYMDDVEACYSANFKVEKEDEFTLKRLIERTRDVGMDDLLRKSTEDGVDVLIDVIKHTTGKDFARELKLMFVVDALFLNEDRHLNNISVLQSKDGIIRFSPIFDNGMSLLSRLDTYPLTRSIVKNVSTVTPYLFEPDFKTFLDLFNYEPFLYKDKIKQFVKQHEELLDRAGRVILYQLQQPHLQKLFITENPLLRKSSLFS